MLQMTYNCNQRYIYYTHSERDMKFSLEKCTKATLRSGKLIKTTSIMSVKDKTEISKLDQTQTSSHLEITEPNKVQHTRMIRLRRIIMQSLY